jgi:hypothetical protein
MYKKKSELMRGWYKHISKEDKAKKTKEDQEWIEWAKKSNMCLRSHLTNTVDLTDCNCNDCKKEKITRRLIRKVLNV